MTSHNVKVTTQWPAASLITDFDNYRVNFLPTEWMTTCFEQSYYLLNIKHVLLSVVLRNDREINVIDHARVVKTY